MRTLHRFAIALWIAIGTLFSSHFWIANPQFFPEFRKPLAYWLVDLYGAQNQEEIADLEGWVGLFLGFVATSLVTWLAVKAWRCLKTPKSST